MPAPKYAELFLAESREHLRSCNRLLLRWEREAGAAEPVGGLFRAIHNLKGMAATMGYSGVADLAHRTETVLDAARQGRIGPTPELIQLLFRAVDALERGAEAAAAGRSGEIEPGLLGELDALTAAPAPGADAAARETAAPQETASDTAAGAGAPAPGAGPAAPGEYAVTVAIRAGAAMRGARAMLALRRAERLGRVSALEPPAAEIERDAFARRFAFRLQSAADPAAIEAAVRSAGDVESVVVERSGAGGRGAAARQVRVELGRLDAVMKRVGELVVARNRLLELARGGDPELEALAARIARLVAELQAEVVAARMTPVGEVFERFPRLVRDLARELGKQIRLEMEGEEIELDRSILDELGDPLLHLVRNAADHGLETPAERVRAGKSPEGLILLCAERERRTVAVRVSDDGRGIDRDAVLARAKRDGLVDPSVTTLSDDQLLKLIGRPGFSTARRVSAISGRGVGVEVAISRVRALGGSLEVRTVAGRGTTFTLRVPLTLAIVRALLAEAGGERYAVPLAYVAETVEFDPRAVTALSDREALVVRDRVIPTVHLRDLVAARPGPAAPRRPTIILEIGDRHAALVVDALLGQQEVVVEPFDAPRGVPPYVGGATILPDGAPALILDAAALV